MRSLQRRTQMGAGDAAWRKTQNSFMLVRYKEGVAAAIALYRHEGVNAL